MADPLKPSHSATRESVTLTRYLLQPVDENDCSNVDANESQSSSRPFTSLECLNVFNTRTVR